MRKGKSTILFGFLPTDKLRIFGAIHAFAFSPKPKAVSHIFSCDRL